MSSSLLSFAIYCLFSELVCCNLLSAAIYWLFSELVCCHLLSAAIYWLFSELVCCNLLSAAIYWLFSELVCCPLLSMLPMYYSHLNCNSCCLICFCNALFIVLHPTLYIHTARKIPFVYFFSGNCAALVPIWSYVCEWLIYSQDRSTYFPAAEKADQSMEIY